MPGTYIWYFLRSSLATENRRVDWARSGALDDPWRSFRHEPFSSVSVCLYPHWTDSTIVSARGIAMTLKTRKVEIDGIPATFAVRLSTVENAVTMAELERDCDVTPHSLSEAMKSHVKGWVCEDAASIVGFAMGARSNGEVLVVAVCPEYERRGIGKSLLRHVQEWLFSEQHDEIWLLANPNPYIRARGFYRKLGWQATAAFKGNNELLKLGKGKNPIADTPTGWAATFSTSASEQDQ